MKALSRQATCQKIMAVAREQAWSNAHQVLGLPVRLNDEPTYTRHWDLTAIAEVLEQAIALQWGPDELIAWTPEDLTHHFAIMRPGRTMRITDYVVADTTTGRLLHLAQDTTEGLPGDRFAGARDQGSPAAWTVTCPAPDPDCARPQDPCDSRAEADALASDHDGLHHGGRMTAQVAPLTRPAVPASPASTEVCWEARLVRALVMAGGPS
jgi:hypothetical protein